MYFTYKKHLWLIFAIFFFAISPFLAVYSLGYSLDLDQKKLGNTIDIDINTVPRGANVWNNNYKVLTTPGSLKAKDGQLVSLNINKDDYLSERFDIWSQPNKNTTARIEDVYLLPAKHQIKEEGGDKKFITILSKNLLLFEKDKEIFVQLYGFSGLQGKPEIVKVSTMFDEEYTIGVWEDLLGDFYWQPETGWLLYKSGGFWNLLDLKQTQLTIDNVVRINDSSILILDADKKLWLIDLFSKIEDLEMFFLANSINGLSFTKSPDSVWLWRNNSLYSIPKGNIKLIGSNLESYQYLSHFDLLNSITSSKPISPNNTIFAVKNVHQGLVFKIGQKLYYVADYEKNNPLLITNNSVSFASASNTVFWLDDSFGLYSFNLGINKQQYFGNIDILGSNLQNTRIFYYGKWERILVYSNDKVISIWFDKDILNESVVNYYFNDWIDDSFCKDAIYEDFQFCIKDNNFISYQNTEIW